MDSAPTAPHEDFVTQCAKLGVGLLSDRYVKQNEELDTSENQNQSEEEKEKEKEKGVRNTSIKPRMFKRLIGKNHPEFSTNRQQDVAEYLRYHFFVLFFFDNFICNLV